MLVSLSLLLIKKLFSKGFNLVRITEFISSHDHSRTIDKICNTSVVIYKRVLDDFVHEANANSNTNLITPA